MINKKKIFLAGHKGMVGSAIYKKLKLNGYKNILVRSRKELDLLNQSKTFKFLIKNKPYFVILAAAKVGGIKDNAKNKDKYISWQLFSRCKKFIFIRIKLHLSKAL